MKVAGKSRFDVLSFAHESSHKNRLLFFLDFSIRERRKQSNNQKCKSNIREWMEAFKNILIFRRIVQRGIYILLHERAKYPIVSKLRRPRLSLSQERPSLGNSESHDSSVSSPNNRRARYTRSPRPFLFYQKRFREKTRNRPEEADEERESMAKKRGRRMVSKDLEGSWPKREPLGMELRGGGWRGCTSGEHRGREEASCKEYKQCVLIRAPWPDECTIVALQGFATNPASTRTLAACRSQRSRAPYIRCPAPGRN